MKYKNKIIIVLVMFFCFVMIEKVDAQAICNRGYMYEITTEITAKDYIEYVRAGGLELNVGPGSYNNGKYSFDYKLVGEKYNDSEYLKYYNNIKKHGNVTDYETIPCNLKYYDKVSIANLWKEAEQTLDVNSGTVTLKINASGLSNEDFSRLTFKIKYAGASQGVIRKDSSTKQVIISGIIPDPVKYLEYDIYAYLTGSYARDFESGIDTNDINYCLTNGSLYITTMKTTIRSLDSYKLKVPDWFRKSEICKTIDDYSKTKQNINKYFDECYKENLSIKYSEYKTLSSTIEARFQKIKNALEPQKITTLDTNNLKCYNPNLGIKDKNAQALPIGSKTTTKVGEFWMMSCTDTYYVEADDPTLVPSGVGVEYTNRVKIDRNCKVDLLNQVEWVPACDHGGSLLCLDSVTGQFTEPAGPNDTFDSCVKKCDGGKYTQSCINSCYAKVYQNDKSTNTIRGMNDYSFTNYVMRRIENGTYVEGSDSIFIPRANQGNTFSKDGYTVQVGYIRSGTFQYGAEGNTNTVTRQQGIQLTITDPSGNTRYVYTASSCLNQNLPCKFDTYCTNCPNCTDGNPEVEYNTKLARLKQEYQDFVGQAEKYEDKIVNYQMSFIDTEDGQVYIVDGSTKKNDAGVKLEISSTGIKENAASTVIENIQIGSQGDTYNAKTRLSNSVTYTIKLPTQYTIKGDPSTILIKGTDGYYKKVNNKSGRYKFERFKVDNQALSKGENVYYTTLNGKDFNREVSCEDTSTKSFSSNPNTGTYLEKIVETNNLKNQYEDTKTQKTFYNFWGEHENYFTSLSYNAYAAYILNNRLVVKELKEEYDNINVSFEFESLNDAFGDEKQHVTSKYDCYYGVYNMLDNNNKCEKPGLRYYYHEINLEKIFDKRDPRWNWTGTINGNKVTGAAKKIDGYIVDPERLIASIEQKGYNIYEDQAVQAQEMDYEYTLDNAKIQAIREYNKIREKGQRLPYTKFTLAKPNNTMDKNFSMKVAEWLGDGFRQKEVAVSTCNNSLAGSCYNYGLGGK